MITLAYLTVVYHPVIVAFAVSVIPFLQCPCLHAVWPSVVDVGWLTSSSQSPASSCLLEWTVLLLVKTSWAEHYSDLLFSVGNGIFRYSINSFHFIGLNKEKQIWPSDQWTSSDIPTKFVISLVKTRCQNWIWLWDPIGYLEAFKR